MSLTRAALALLDAHEATHPTGDGEAWLARGDDLLAAVADAFVLDTAAYNRAEDARAVALFPGGLAWLRGLVERAAPPSSRLFPHLVA